MSFDEDACYDTCLDVPHMHGGKLIAVPGGPGVSGPPGPQGEVGPAGPPGADSTVPGPVGQQGIPGEVGQPGVSLDIEGTVPTYADLPANPAEGSAWVVAADGLLYFFDGTAFPADGSGVPFQGPQGVQGIQGVPGASVTGPAGAPGATGPAGPSAVSADAGNASVLGTDGLVFTPAGGGGGLVTAPSVAGFPAAGEPGKVYLAEDSGDTFRFDPVAKGTDTYVRISETTVSAKIEDSTEVGRDVITAVDKPSGRAAIDAERQARFNVLDYGAVGDGVADDKVSIQLALNAAVAAGGGTVFLPAGQYKVGGGLKVGSGIDLWGVGRESVIKPVYAVASNRVFENTTASANMSFRSFKVDMTGANVQHGFLMNGVTNMLFDGVEFVGPSPTIGGCIAVSGVGTATRLLSKNIRVVNCVFSDTTNFGVALSYVDGAVIANNVAHNAGREVFGVEPEAACVSRNITISGNTIFGAPTIVGSSTGFIVLTTSSGGTIDGVTITGNTIRQNPTATTAQLGITVIGATNVTMTGNNIAAVGGSGIQVGVSGYVTAGTVISGNSVTDCAQFVGSPAIALRNASFSTVTGNYVQGVKHTSSVSESSGAVDNLITSNILRDAVPFGTAAAESNDPETLISENRATGDGSTVFGNKSITADNAAWLGANTTAAATLVLNGTTSRTLAFAKAGVARWTATVSGTESGGNTGSELTFQARDDAGVNLGNVLTLKRAGRSANFTGGLSMYRRAVAIDYQMQTSECIVAVTDTTAPRLMRLPAAAAAGAGWIITVNDESGGASKNKITVSAPGTEKIDGVSSVVIDKDYGAVQLYCTGTGWSVVQSAAGSVTGSAAGTVTSLTLWTGTKSQYDAISVKSQTCIYVVSSVAVTTGDIMVDEGAETGDITAEPPTEPVADEPAAERAAPAVKTTRKK